MQGRLHSLQSLGTVDGPGVRAVVFLQGCPLRCLYCHNPDTWDFAQGSSIDSDALVARILKLKPYLAHGGVTFSGGEPCVQSEFVRHCALQLRQAGLHIALDTSGALLTPQVEAMLEAVDLVLLDVKMTTEAAYRRDTGGSLAQTLRFLQHLQQRALPTWIRHVVVPGYNDTPADIAALQALLRPYSVVEKIELLPFRNLCLEKYRALGIPFPLEHTPPLCAERLHALAALLADGGGNCQAGQNQL